MSRADEIFILRHRYEQAISAGKRKTASIIAHRLLSLVTRQVKIETKQDRRIA